MMHFRLFCGLGVGVLGSVAHATDPSVKTAVAEKVAAEYPSLEALYLDLHQHPELSLLEEQTAAKVAAQLRTAGLTVTEKVGGYGVVGVLKNGDGPTVLVRSDLDGLPVLEETGLAYASRVRAKDLAGRDVPVMHACGHDVHMTSLIGVARVLASLRERWRGTIVFVGQPAEERGVGARAMLSSGLYRNFPKPDFALALHDSATLPAGSVGTVEGFAMANVDWVDITVRGIGGHGAYPHTTKDPIVLAARIVLALQTIVSRETRPLDPAVITVGSIHGGEKANVIPNEVKLQLTLRSYSEAVREHLIEAIRRTCRGEAIAAGIPDALTPTVKLIEEEHTPATYNTPELTRRLHGVFVEWLGSERVVAVDPEMGGEDFSEFGRTTEHVPICLFKIGAVAPEKVEESRRTGVSLPSLHSSKFAPVPEPTLKTAITAMSAAVLELLPATK